MTRAEKISLGLRRWWARQRRESPLPGLARMKLSSEPGDCPFCDQKLANNPSGRKAHTCGAPECRTAWMRCYQRDRRREIRMEASP